MGGVGKAFGGMAGEPSILGGLDGLGENGGVGAIGRGVEPLDPVPGVAWVCYDLTFQQIVESPWVEIVHSWGSTW